MNSREGLTRLNRAVIALGCAAGLAACSEEPMDTQAPAASAPAATPAPAPAPAEPSWTYIKSNHPNVGDQFGGGGAAWGYSLALAGDGQTLAIGARMEDSAASGVGGNPDDNSLRDSGAAYVYTRSGDGWAEQAYLKASNPGASDMFAFSMAISRDGNTLAVSAPAEDSGGRGIDPNGDNDDVPNSGAVYVFTR